MPVRLRLSRAAGFDLQAASRARNGLPAVAVARPSRWGNPWVVGGPRGLSAEVVVGLFEAWWSMAPNSHAGPWLLDQLPALRGCNLACWCTLDQPWCHADSLLRLANFPLHEQVGTTYV